MAQDIFRNTRILIADAKPGRAKLLRSILARIGVHVAEIAEDTHRALDMLTSAEFEAIFCDEGIGPEDVVSFSIMLRRSTKIRNPRLAIIVVSDGPRRSDVEAGRDSGVNDFIVRPISTDTVKRKLQAVLSTPKPFVHTDVFCGPDRRRKRERRVTKILSAGAGRERRKPRPARRSTDAKLKPQS